MDQADTPTPPVLVEDRDGIRRIVLNRPAARNLLTEEMIAALEAAFEAPAARVIVIASAGPAFCAGHDMKAMARHHDDADGGAAYFADLFARCGQMMARIASLPQPVIAEVHAPAVAAGCQLVAACDLAIAADSATFGTTGVAFGLYCSTPAVPLTRTVAPKHAAHMLMTGDLVDAAHAARIGLINRAVPAAGLTQETMALAARIASHSAAVLALGKRSVATTRALPLEAAYAAASGTMVENLLLADGREGLAAFAGKRPATWRNLPDDRLAFWNARYGANAAPFGEAPTAYVAKSADRLPRGRAFVAADGEGRNARHLAALGLEVTINDLSDVALSRAAERAAAAGLAVRFHPGNLLLAPPEEGAFDAVVVTYLQLPPAERRAVHRHLAAALAPGGVLLLEAFGKPSAALGESGCGPREPALRYAAADLVADFAPLVPLQLETCDVTLDEGSFHTGPASVVRGLFQRGP
ncbi:MAG: hypothetical protein AcusKO_34650 [Acuticoccus sp.]